MSAAAVVTGVGLITPLGDSPREVLERMERGQEADRRTPFDSSAFDCRRCARVKGFVPEDHFADCKTLRLMNRDAGLRSQTPISQRAVNPRRARVSSSSSGTWSSRLMGRPNARESWSSQTRVFFAIITTRGIQSRSALKPSDAISGPSPPNSNTWVGPGPSKLTFSSSLSRSRPLTSRSR
jgi:hypothetical protein